MSPRLTEKRAAENLAAHRMRMIAGLATGIRERGLANTQVSDIVENARASRTTFYRCFADKNECLAALAEIVFTVTRQRVLESIDLSAPWYEQVDQALDTFFEIAEEEHAIAATFTTELPGMGSRGEQIRLAREEQYAEMVLALAQNPLAIEKHGDLSHVTTERAVALVSAIEGLLSRAALRDEDFRTFAPIAKDVARRILAPQGPNLTGD